MAPTLTKASAQSWARSSSDHPPGATLSRAIACGSDGAPRAQRAVRDGDMKNAHVTDERHQRRVSKVQRLFESRSLWHTRMRSVPDLLAVGPLSILRPVRHQDLGSPDGDCSWPGGTSLRAAPVALPQHGCRKSYARELPRAGSGWRQAQPEESPPGRDDGNRRGCVLAAIAATYSGR